MKFNITEQEVVQRASPSSQPKISRWVKNLNQIPETGGTLVLSDHPMLPRLILPALALRAYRPDIRIVLDAGVAPIADMFSTNTIKVNEPDKHLRAGSWIEAYANRFFRYLGERINYYKNDGSQTSTAVKQKIIESVNDGQAVLLLPTGRSNPETHWHSIAGRAISDFKDKDTIINFLHIPRVEIKQPSTLFERPVIFSNPTINELKTVLNCTKRLPSKKLEKYYYQQLHDIVNK